MKKLLEKKYTKVILLAILAFLSICVFSINLDQIDINKLESGNRIAKFFEKCIKSFQGNNIAYILIFIALYYFYSKTYLDGKKINKVAVVLSTFFSIMMVLGYSYQRINSWDLVFGSGFQLMKSIIVILGYYTMFYIVIKKLYEMIDRYEIKEIKSNSKVINFIFEKHAFIMPFIIILLFWLPYIIFFYPGTTPGGDVKAEIYSFYHMDNYTVDSINLISEEVYLNTHHPIIHTLLLGFFMKIGEVFNNYTLGLFLYTLLQVIVTAVLLSYIILWMKKRNMPIWLRIISLGIFCLLSFIPMFAVNLGKEMYSSIFTVMYVILLFDLTIYKDKINKKMYIFLLIVTMLLIMLFRNDGIYRVVIPFICFIIYNRKHWKKLLIILVIVVGFIQIYNNILLPSLKISKGSIREMLSIPFQQTARTVVVHGKNAYTEEEKKVINQILDYNKLSEYDPNLSDPVKNRFKKDSTKEELINYFKVWFKNFFKYPTDYIQATLNNTYQYFYPDQNKNIGYTSLEGLDDGIFDVKINTKFDGARTIIVNMHKALRNLPIIGMIYRVGFHIYMMLIAIGYLIWKKQYKMIVVLMPLIITLLICLASPVNGHWRYSLPIMMSFTVIISSMIYTTLNNKGEDNA